LFPVKLQSFVAHTVGACSAHPNAPNRPPYETLVGFLQAPIDKLKDVFAKFPTEEMKEGAKGN
jgi:hypothetical protein